MSRLLTIALLLIALRSDAANMFLHLDGVIGESRSARHANWIEVEHFQIAGANAREATRPSFQPLSVSKNLDKSSPQLFNLTTTGRILSNAVFEVIRPEASAIRVLQFKLGQVSAQNFHQSGHHQGGVMESLSLQYASIRWTYTEISTDGRPLRDISTSWNFDSNTGSGGTLPTDTDNDGLPDIYERLYGLNSDLFDANGDLDTDGMSNIEEFRAGTQPNQADSIFRVSGTLAEPGTAALNWQPTGKTYRLMGAASPDQPFQFIRFLTETEAASGQLQLQTTSNFAFFILEAE